VVPPPVELDEVEVVLPLELPSVVVPAPLPEPELLAPAVVVPVLPLVEELELELSDAPQPVAPMTAPPITRTLKSLLRFTKNSLRPKDTRLFDIGA